MLVGGARSRRRRRFVLQLRAKGIGMKETYGLITYFLECAGDNAAKLETFVKLLLTHTKKVKDIDAAVRSQTLAACVKAMCVHCRNGRKPINQPYGGRDGKWKYPAWVHQFQVGKHVRAELCEANKIRLLQTRAVDPDEHDNFIREDVIEAVFLHLSPFREELDYLLCDEDLTDEKLRAASEGLLPRLADAIRRIRQLKPAPSEPEKILQQGISK